MLANNTNGAGFAGGTNPRAEWIVIGLIALAGFIIMGKDISRGALADADSAAHMMDGVLIHDWVMAGPKAWMSPMVFAEQQYGHYPTLGIGRHYPPAFAVVEAAFFGVFGVSGATSRLCVAFFGALGAVGAYVFVRSVGSRGTAALAALLWIAIPATTFWGRQTMLEVPTMAALVWSAVAFSWYLRRRTGRRLLLASLCAILSIAFKQPAVFLICAMAMTLTWSAWRGRGPWGHAVFVVALGVASLGGVLLALDDASLKTVSGYDTFASRWALRAITYYLRTLPEHTGTLLLIPAAAGGLLAIRRMGDRGWLLAAWLMTSYLMVTIASLKTPRFFYFGVFPIVVWAAVGVERGLELVPRPRLRGAAIAVALGYLVWAGFTRPLLDGPDFGPVVAANRDRLEGHAVLFSGLRDGDFVFSVRERIPWQKTVVIRGSKLFYTCTAGPDLDLVSYAESDGALAEMMRRFAFESVFVERDNRVGTRQDDWLREYLAGGGDYVRTASFVVQSAKSRCGSDVMLDVYSLKRPMPRQVEHFDIPMPRTKRSIRIALPAAATGERPS